MNCSSIGTDNHHHIPAHHRMMSRSCDQLTSAGHNVCHHYQQCCHNKNNSNHQCCNNVQISDSCCCDKSDKKWLYECQDDKILSSDSDYFSFIAGQDSQEGQPANNKGKIDIHCSTIDKVIVERKWGCNITIRLK